MNTKPINCIIVDDDEVDRLTVMAFLENYPFINITGNYDNPEEALEAAKKNPPDALFLDIDMPGMSGLQLRAQLQHIPCLHFLLHLSRIMLLKVLSWKPLIFW